MINKVESLKLRVKSLQKSALHIVCFILKVVLFTLLTFNFSLFTRTAFAEEPPTIITSDTLEHEKKISTYTAKGSVKVTQDKTTMEAKEMIYDEDSSYLFAEGDVRYETPDITLKAEKAVYNLNTKKGTFFNAEIFSKKEKFHVSGAEIEKTGEKEYFLTEATITTCDSPSPAWCIKGKNAEITVGDRLKSRNTTFNVLGVPILYTPYLWAPVLNERKTGLLTPVFGYSKTKGFSYRQPFFWAISGNKDATVIIDWYAKRGLGEGLEYRYVEPGNVEGTHWAYHIHDTKTGKDFYELRSSHEKRADSISGYMNLNLLNRKEFYREYGLHRTERIKRFTESTGELSMPTDNSRFYLMSQYFMDLKDGSHDSEIVQRLPEFGYVINPYSVGPVIFSLTSSASNFWREKGVFGQRLDIHPKFSHAFGDKLVISQSLGLRKTAYLLHQNENEGFREHVQRDMFDYNVTASSRLMRDYSSFTHAVEPSLGYTYVPWIKKEKTNLPLFDSTELYSKQSTVQLSILNRLFDKQGEFFTLSLSESYNSFGGDRPFSPLTIAASIGRPISLRGDISYNSYSGRIESINSDMSAGIKNLSFSLGERYNKVNDTMSYNAGITYTYSKNLSTDATVWYDAKGEGLRDAMFNIKYQKQCWGVTLLIDIKPGDAVTKRPSDYSIIITFDLLGLGSLKV